MFKNLMNKFVSSTEEKEKQQVVARLVETLKKAKNSPGFICFVSFLYDDNGEQKLNHNMFRVKFKDDDMFPTLEEHKKLVNNYLQKQPKNILENNQEKNEGSFKVE